MNNKKFKRKRVMDIYAKEDFFNELRRLPAYWTIVEEISDELMYKEEK